ncbi:MAG: hypothetical protein WCK00_10685, partial [Deltaproteobacteria bacterium]
VHALEDRTYPRERPSAGTSGDGQIKCLFRRRKRQSQHKKQHENSQKAEGRFPFHQVTSAKSPQTPYNPILSHFRLSFISGREKNVQRNFSSFER